MAAGEPLTDTQQKWLHILSTVFGFLSFAASITVMQIVRHSKLKKGRLSTYDRLLFGISACDLANSIATGTDSYFEPRDNEYNMVWAFGNDATCNLAGFLSVFYITTWLYHAAISLYYVMLIKYGFRDDNIGWKFELSLHLVAILWPACIGAIGFALNAMGPTITSYGCFVNEWPPGCVQSTSDNPLEEGEAKCNGSLASWTTIPPIVASFLTILSCNLIIYYHVRSTVLKTTRNSVLQFDNIMSHPPSASRQLSRRQNQSVVISTGQLERVRAVRNQSLLYFLVTLSSCLPIAIQKHLSQYIPSLSRETESSIYPLLLLRAIFTPVSGFFNLIIFCRPTYLRYRRNFPEVSRIVAFRRTIEAGTGRSKGTPRRHCDRSMLQQNGWWDRFLKRGAVVRQENAGSPATPCVVVPPIVDKKRDSAEDGKQENTKSSNVATHRNVYAERDKVPTSVPTPHKPDQEGEEDDTQLITDGGGGWRPGKPKTNSDVDYGVGKNAFLSNASINFVMDDGSSDQKLSFDAEDEEVASSSTGVHHGLISTVFSSGASLHNEGSSQPHASQRDEAQHRSRLTSNWPTIQFDSSCIGSISTTSTVEA